MTVGQIAPDPAPATITATGAPKGAATGTTNGTATATASGIVVEVAGDVDPDVVAALVAAVDVVWPRPPSGEVSEENGVPAWRFSGRWWSRPATHRRVRPWT